MAFPSTSILAALNGSTAENPINEGGKWKILSWCVNAGEIHGSADGYTSATAAVELNGCYWTPAEFTEPGVSWEPLFPENLKEEWFALWACLNPTSHNGYRLRAESLGAEANFKIISERVTGGTATTLGETANLKIAAKDLLGISAVSGKVISWHKIGAGGAWEELKAIADSTYTNGNVGMETKSKSSDFGQINFAAGGAPLNVIPRRLRIITAQSLSRSSSF
jgi:hypothetical protein